MCGEDRLDCPDYYTCPVVADSDSPIASTGTAVFSAIIATKSTMSATQPAPSKGSSYSGSLPSPSQGQLPPSQNDSHARRAGGSGTFGAGANTRPTSSPRNNQSAKKQHKGRRPKLASDEPLLENVSLT